MQNLFCVFDTSFYRALYAKGRLRENALISPTVLFLSFPIVYVLFKNGFSPVVLSWASLISYAILGLVVKPLLVTKIVGYTWKDVFSVFVPCLKVTAVAVILPIAFWLYFSINNILIYISLMTIMCILSVGVTTWYLGMDAAMRERVVAIIKKKIKDITIYSAKKTFRR